MTNDAPFPHHSREPSHWETAQQIADQLAVTDSHERERVITIVRELGRTQARALFQEALPQEEPLRTFFALVETKGQKKVRWRGDETIPSDKREQALVTATHISRELGETDSVPRRQIERIVSLLGREKAMGLLAETQQIEAQGGMLTGDGSRRRTPGGVYFALTRQQAPPAQRSRIFPQGHKPQRSNAPSAQKQGATPQAAVPPLVEDLTWEKRQAVLVKLASDQGEGRLVKITLIGRPGKVIEQASCVITTMRSTKIPSLPKGLPVPDAASTNYVVYIATKQWKKVAESIKQEDDALIVEGFPVLDETYRQISVFATNVTTKLLQAAKRTT